MLSPKTASRSPTLTGVQGATVVFLMMWGTYQGTPATFASHSRISSRMQVGAQTMAPPLDFYNNTEYKFFPYVSALDVSLSTVSGAAGSPPPHSTSTRVDLDAFKPVNEVGFLAPISKEKVKAKNEMALMRVEDVYDVHADFGAGDVKLVTDALRCPSARAERASVSRYGLWDPNEMMQFCHVCLERRRHCLQHREPLSGHHTTHLRNAAPAPADTGRRAGLHSGRTRVVPNL